MAQGALDFSQERLNCGQIQEFSGCHHASRAVMFLIEVAARGVDRDEKIRRNRERALDEPVVRLVTDAVQFGQRIAHFKSLVDEREQFRVGCEDGGVFIKHCGRRPTFRQPGPTEFHNQCGGIVRSGKSGELQDAGVKNELQGKVWPGARKFRGGCPRRKRWLASRSRTFRRCACAPPPAPVEAETAELCRELWLCHTYCEVNLRKPLRERDRKS